MFLCVSGMNAVTHTVNVYYHEYDTLSQVNCIAHIWFGHTSLSGNIVNIMFIALERTVAVYFPLKSIYWITSSKAKKVFSWFRTDKSEH